MTFHNDIDQKLSAMARSRELV